MFGLIMFQSSPGLVTGRYLAREYEEASNNLFQSSPGLVTGRYRLLIWRETR